VVFPDLLKEQESCAFCGDAHIVVSLDDTMPQFSVFGDIDLTMEHE
jgi:hypothetical protein